MRATAGLALSGRYGAPAAQAARGLEIWATRSGVDLSIEDTGTDARSIERFYRRAADRVELLFGPYGSGPLRAAERALRGHDAVLWNHGGAAGGARRGPRVVDVLGPATAYWRGLADVLRAREVALDAVAICHVESPFGRGTAESARRSLVAAGGAPIGPIAFDRSSAADVVDLARVRGARCVIGCGRIEDDLALMRHARSRDLVVGAIVAGVALAHDELGADVVGSFGPAQWLGGDATPLGPGADYPAAQAFAAGEIAMAARSRAGSSHPDRLWDAARALRCRSLLGPFEIDSEGRQTAQAPLVVEWVAGAEGPRRRVAWSP